MKRTFEMMDSSYSMSKSCLLDISHNLVMTQVTDVSLYLRRAVASRVALLTQSTQVQSVNHILKELTREPWPVAGRHPFGHS